MEAIRVFIGVDPLRELAAKTLMSSILARTRHEVLFHRLDRIDCTAEARFYTGFSFYRWAIPWLCGFDGKAIYLDGDIVCLCDIVELWRRPFAGRTHLCRPMAGGGAHSSVMLIDCGRARWPFGEWSARAAADQAFYDRVMWCEAPGPTAENLGPLPDAFNHLDAYEPDTTKLIHFTDVDTQPWVRPGHAYEALFFDAFASAIGTGFITRADLEAARASGAAYRADLLSCVDGALRSR